MLKHTLKTRFLLMNIVLNLCFIKRQLLKVFKTLAFYLLPKKYMKILKNFIQKKSLSLRNSINHAKSRIGYISIRKTMIMIWIKRSKDECDFKSSDYSEMKHE